jgi:hypothetical protein
MLPAVRVLVSRRVLRDLGILMAVGAAGSLVRQSSGHALVVHLAIAQHPPDRLRLEGRHDHEEDEGDATAQEHGFESWFTGFANPER